MRLPAFEYARPERLEEALELLARHGDRASVMAGGTDLVVRMKQRLVQPAFLISLTKVKDLDYVRQEDDVIKIGAMTSLNDVKDSQLIRSHFPALVQALRLIGAATIQRFRGTIGGNLCLQTRCLYYNQSAFWRSGRTRCHKDRGEICYAEENSDRCRSANQSDGACALMVLDATIELASHRGDRAVPIEAFFTGKGESPFALEPDELVTGIRLPMRKKGEGSSFQKLMFRSAIDYGLVSSSVWLAVKDGHVSSARIAVGGAGASPLLLKEAAGTLVGTRLGDTGAIGETATQVRKHASAFMVDNLGSTLEYRQKMAGVLAKRAIMEALERVES